MSAFRWFPDEQWTVGFLYGGGPDRWSWGNHVKLIIMKIRLDWIKIGFDLIWFDLIWFDLIWFDLIWFDLIWFDLIWFDLSWVDLILFDLIWIYLIWFNFLFSFYHFPFYFSCVFLTFIEFSCFPHLPVLSFLLFSYLVLSFYSYLKPNIGFVSVRFLIRWMIWSVLIWRFLAMSSTFQRQRLSVS